MRLDRILVAIDFGDASLAALGWTARHFAPAAQLTLVHVVVAPEAPSLVRSLLPRADSLVDDARVGADVRLRALGADVPTTDGRPPIGYETRVGAPAEALLASAAAHGADLVVVGRHGDRGGPRDWLGSTAESVLRASAVPVLLVADPRDAPPRRVLLALDDDELTPVVLRAAADLCARFDADLLSMHVLRSVPTGTPLAMAEVGLGGVGLDPAFVAEQMDRLAERWTARVAKAGIPCQRGPTEVTVGDPGHEIVAAAQRSMSELIVVGNRRGPPGRTMLGSAVRHVLRHAPCPVLALTAPLDDVADEAE